MRGPNKQLQVLLAFLGMAFVCKKCTFALSLLPVPLRSALLNWIVRFRCSLYALKRQGDLIHKEFIKKSRLLFF